MGEPARNFDDDSSTEPVIRPNLHAIDGGGETSQPKTGHLSAVDGDGATNEDSGEAPQRHLHSVPTGDDATAADQQESAQLAKKVGGNNDLIGGGFQNEKGGGSFVDRLKSAATSGKVKKGATGLGVGGGVAAVFIAGFMMLVPMKITSMMENIRGRFFATSEDAIDRQTDNLMTHYIRKHVLPNLNGTTCKSTISKNCVSPDIVGDGPASTLYKTWKDARIENKLAERHGIEFAKDVQTNKFYMKVGDQNVDLTDLVENNKSLSDLDSSSRGDLRRKTKKVLREETRWYQVMYRYQVGGLLDRKFGVQRCIFVCGPRDKLADWKEDKALTKKAYKTKLVERVITPRSEMLALTLACVINSGCKPEAVDEGATGEGGERRSKFEEDMEKKLASLSSKFGEEAVEDAIAKADNILEKGFTRHIVEEVVQKVIAEFAEEGAEKAGQAAGSAVPVVGWINTAAQIINTLKDTGPKLKKLVYATNAASYVQTFTMFMTYSDEMKSGNIDAEMFGSFTTALGANTKADGTGATAESTPIYRAMISNEEQKVSVLDDLLSQKTYAQGSANASDYGNYKGGDYKCDNGKPVPSGKLVCPEEDLRYGSWATSVGDIFQLPGLAQLGSLADVWTDTVSSVTEPITNAIGGLIEKAPGYDAAVSLVSEHLGEIMESIATEVIPSAINSDMDGGRTFTAILGGGDVAGNEYCQHGLGCQAVTNQQSAEIRTAYLNEQEETFKQGSFFARMFDTNSRFSLVSRVSMSMPLDKSYSARSAITSILKNPFSKVASVLNGMFFAKKADAALQQFSEDPFGVQQYAYLKDDPVFTTDPETYTTAYCADFTKRWNESSVIDEATGQQKNTTTNPCLLTSGAASAAGGLYSDAVIAKDDRIKRSNGSATASDDSSATQCDSRTVDKGEAEGYEQGVLTMIRICEVPNIPGGTVVSSVISGKTFELGEAAAAAGINLSSSESFRTKEQQEYFYGCYTMAPPKCNGGNLAAKPGFSNHQRGLAIDFRCNGGSMNYGDACFNWLSANAGPFGYAATVGGEPWHWSTNGK